MPKTILVPTDYSIRSLHILKHALNKDVSDSLNIVFFTGVILQDSITELLFFSKRNIIESLTTNEFKEACQIIRNKYSTRITSMRFDVFTGFTQAAFNNFIEGNTINEVYIPQNKLHYASRCFDATPYMRKCVLPKTVVSWPETPESSQPNHLNELFTSWT
jgi:hypothetical protein